MGASSPWPWRDARCGVRPRRVRGVGGIRHPVQRLGGRRVFGGWPPCQRIPRIQRAPARPRVGPLENPRVHGAIPGRDREYHRIVGAALQGLTHQAISIRKRMQRRCGIRCECNWRCGGRGGWRRGGSCCSDPTPSTSKAVASGAYKPWPDACRLRTLSVARNGMDSPRGRRARRPGEARGADSAIKASPSPATQGAAAPAPHARASAWRSRSLP